MVLRVIFKQYQSKLPQVSESPRLAPELSFFYSGAVCAQLITERDDWRSGLQSG